MSRIFTLLACVLAVIASPLQAAPRVPRGEVGRSFWVANAIFHVNNEHAYDQVVLLSYFNALYSRDPRVSSTDAFRRLISASRSASAVVRR